MTAQQARTIALRGGLNLVTPSDEMPPGYVLASENYEAVERGYRRFTGYERFDGRLAPSDAQFATLRFDTGSTAVVEGNTLTGATSGATGIVLADWTVETGTTGGGDAAGYIVLGEVAGTFQDDEDLQVSSSTVAVADGTQTSSDPLLEGQKSAFLGLAEERRRALIQAVPGSGPVRGVAILNGDVFALRDNVGATECLLYKATAAGWTLQTLSPFVGFTGGTSAFQEGETLTGGISGATATIERVMVHSGAFGPDAAGEIVLSGVSGTFQSGEMITSASGSATASGAQSTPTIAPGGRYTFISHNFFGMAGNDRLYAAGGVGRAFEWDGSVFAKINTGLSVSLDKPTHVGVMSEHLLLGYRQGSIQISETGNATQFKATGGAGEITLGSEVRGLISNASTSTIILGKDRIAYLSGTDTTNFVMRSITDDAGAVEWSSQLIGTPIYMDARGLRRLNTTEQYGDWKMGTMSQIVRPLFESMAERSVQVVASTRVRSRGQYLVFFDDKTALNVYLERKNPEFMPLRLPFEASCATDGERADERELILVGDSEGFVYELNRGRSFDGVGISAALRLVFDNIGSPNDDKRFHSFRVHADAPDGASIKWSLDFGYGNPRRTPQPSTNGDLIGSGAFWGGADWGDFNWDVAIQEALHGYVDGLGTNYSAGFVTRDLVERDHTLTSTTMMYTRRRQRR